MAAPISPILDQMADGLGVFKVITGQTAHATPGTAKNIPHGLSRTPTFAIPVPTTYASAGIVTVESVDGTNVSVKSTVASTAFVLLVFY